MTSTRPASDEGGATPDLATVTTAYGTWATAYIDLFDGADKASGEDRDRIARWADGLRGPVLDAGCGPGHWSRFLHDRGVAVEGVDATPAFVDHAARSHPGIRFRLGDLRDLALEDGSLGGVLAWFSLIHTDPREVPAVLGTFARALRPGGSLLLGFVTDDDLRTFDHRVVRAWAWPVQTMAATVEATGLRVASTTEQPTPNGRIAASLVADRPAS